MLVPLGKAQEVWDEIAAAMCGEYLVKDMSIITGLSINLKNNVSVIKIWNNDRIKNDSSILPDFLKQYGNIIYRKHQLDF
jgi:hypothetical protein